MVKKYQTQIGWFLKSIAVVLALFATYKFVEYSPWENLQIDAPEFLFLAIILMPLNWCLESKRWQILLKPLFKVTFRKALFGVLSGLGASFLAGKTIGNVLGRYWAIPKEVDRDKSIGALFVSQLTQGIHTFWIGIPCLLWFLKSHVIKVQEEYLYYLTGMSVLLLLIVVVCWKNIQQLSFIQHIFQRYFSILKLYTSETILKTFSLGLLRYSVFTIQFLLIVHALNSSIAIGVILLVIPVIFLIKTISPNLGGLLDLGIREISTLYIFEYLSLDPQTALMSALIIWGINILTPSLIGLGIRWKI